jgi:hypothetical protein
LVTVFSEIPSFIFPRHIFAVREITRNPTRENSSYTLQYYDLFYIQYFAIIMKEFLEIQNYFRQFPILREILKENSVLTLCSRLSHGSALGQLELLHQGAGLDGQRLVGHLVIQLVRHTASYR